MKTKVNKSLTYVCDVPQVKEALKEFKGYYTDGDLLHAFRDAVNFYDGSGSDIIECNVEAFPESQFSYNENTVFCVEITLKLPFVAFYEIRFYCDMGLTVDTRTAPIPMYNVRTYKLTA